VKGGGGLHLGRASGRRSRLLPDGGGRLVDVRGSEGWRLPVEILDGFRREVLDG
jgi:hypothetical protein